MANHINEITELDIALENLLDSDKEFTLETIKGDVLVNLSVDWGKNPNNIDLSKVKYVYRVGNQTSKAEVITDGDRETAIENFLRDMEFIIRSGNLDLKADSDGVEFDSQEIIDFVTTRIMMSLFKASGGRVVINSFQWQEGFDGFIYSIMKVPEEHREEVEKNFLQQMQLIEKPVLGDGETEISAFTRVVTDQ